MNDWRAGINKKFNLSTCSSPGEKNDPRCCKRGCATMRQLMMFVLLAIFLRPAGATSADEALVKKLVHDWAPLVWLAPGERYLPLGVPEFLDHMQEDESYLRTRNNLHSLLENRSSFLYGRKPSGLVPIYALVKHCQSASSSGSAAKEPTADREPGDLLLVDELTLEPIDTNDVPVYFSRGASYAITLAAVGNDFGLVSSRSRTTSCERLCCPVENRTCYESVEPPLAGSSVSPPGRRLSRSHPGPSAGPKPIRKKLKLQLGQRGPKQKQRPGLHFHVTYWMFYPFSEGKSVCVLDLGILGSWPVPSLAGVCIGKFKEYGSHVGDWEHVSLYFRGKDQPAAMYVSAHDAGAFYRYDSGSDTFVFESQETRKGIFQKPVFPQQVFTAEGSHPVLFSARGSHGLWTAPGRHKFVRLPRLYDESGFGTPWPTWRKLELLPASGAPPWMGFTGRWGNPKTNCLPFVRLGFDICEFVDGPTGIPMKKTNFKC